jgi:tRNA pseudouridine55 synthase
VFGFLLIDKPAGITSRQVVVRVEQRLLEMIGPTTVGHCGTLDPLATGLMVLAIGPATSLTPWFLSGNKRYEATFQLGVTSESLDLETPVQPVESGETPELETVQQTCGQFIGRRQQVPPKYSAIRVQGKRAYELARRGADFELAPREITIHDLHVIKYAWPWVQVSVHCSGGTYIRTLGDDLAREWGTRAVMTELRRTGASGFSLSDAWSWESVATESAWATSLINIATALRDMTQVTTDLEMAKRFRNGLIGRALDAQLEALYQGPGISSRDDQRSKEALVLLPDGRPVGIAHRRSKPGHEDAWRIKLNLAQWLEPDLV